MSVQAMAWAMTQDTVTSATQRHVLLILANYAGEDGRGAWPSAATVGRITGLSERAVRGALAALEKSGVIVRGNQAIAAAYIGRSDRRPVVWDMPEVSANRGAADAPRRSNGVQQVHPDDVNGVHHVPQRGAAGAPKPSINHQKDQKQGRVNAPDLPAWLDPDLWAMWHRYRNSRKGWTDDARKLSLRTLTKLHDQGHDPRAVIEQSIENSWAGLFAPKNEERNHAGHRESAAERVRRLAVEGERRDRAAATAIHGSQNAVGSDG